MAGVEARGSGARARSQARAAEAIVIEPDGWRVMMSFSEDQADCCPHCRRPFEIVFVRFGFGRTAMISCCPNCAMVSADVWRAAESKSLDNAKKLARITRDFGWELPTGWKHLISDSGT
jgi:hypothetical protein